MPSEKIKLTPKEQKAIDMLQEVAKMWPRSLSIGGDSDNPNVCTVWKRFPPGSVYHSQGVAKVKIRNEDEDW